MDCSVQQRLSYTAQRNLLNQEVRRLFENGCNVSDIHATVQADQRFDHIRRYTTHSMYDYLTSVRDNNSCRQERKNKSRLRQQIQRDTNQNHYFTGPIRFEKNKTYDISVAICKWSDRYFLGANRLHQTDLNVHHIYLFDLYKNETIGITFPKKHPFLAAIHHLDGNFGLIFESNDKYTATMNFFINLVYLNFEQRQFERLRIYEFPCHLPKIMVDAQDPSKFVIRGIDRPQSPLVKFIQPARWNSEGITFEEPIFVNHPSFWCMGSYCKDQFYSFNFAPDTRNNGIDNGRITCFDPANSTHKSVQLQSPNQDFKLTRQTRRSCKFEWVADRVYIAIRFPQKYKYGVAWASYESPTWMAINFVVGSPIENIAFVNNSALLIQVDVNKLSLVAAKNKKEQRYYKIAYGKPDFLCTLSWMQLIRTMKNDNIPDLYEKVNAYQPLNFEETINFLKTNSQF